MMKLRGALGTLCILLFAGIAVGQKDYTKEADLIFKVQSYYAALDAYKKAYPKEKDNQEKSRILYRVGECYRLLQQPDQALIWYQKAESAEFKSAEMYVHSGDCHMKTGSYDEAMEEYRAALSASPTSSVKREAELGIKACEAAVEMAKNPARYMIRNEVQLNSKYYDFSPYFADKKLESLIFTSTRPAGGGSNLDPITGEGFSDIYFTERDPKGKWSSPTPLSEIVNTGDNEGAAVFDDKYSELYYTKCGYDEKRAFGCQIYKTRKQGQDFAEPELLDFGIDDTTVAAHPVFIDNDFILYVSDMRGGQGGKDLWYIKFEKKTKMWGPPVNLGPDFNTAGDEMFPYIRENGDLYFASNGHIGMGGLDIFRCKMLGEDIEELKWGKPENLKAPINSSANDFGIIYEEEKDRGFFSSDRAGGKGKDDIYSFMMPPLIFMLKGTITSYDEDGGDGSPLGNVKVKLLGTDGTVAETKTDGTGAYEFEMKDNDERYIVANTSYTIEVSAIEEPASDGQKYLGSKGQETTVGLEESTAFIKDFALVCADCGGDIKMPLVLYALGKWDLLVNDVVNSKDSLEYLYTILKENSTITIELAAHTDTRGQEKANQILSQKRAETCVNYLIEKGIDPARMTPIGYGESRPIISDEQIAAMNTEEEREAGHQKNRRTVFRVLSFDFIPPSQDGASE